MGHHLVSSFGPARQYRRRHLRSYQLGQRFGDCGRGVIGEQRVFDLPTANSTAANRHRFDVAYRPGDGEGLQRGLGDEAIVVFDEDENPAHISPNSTNRSTTAGAASGPRPRMLVTDFSSGGVNKRSMTSPPGVAEAGADMISAFFARRRPGKVG